MYLDGGGESGFTTATLAPNQDYDPLSDSWHTVMPMPTARSGPAAAAVGGRIYAVGGSIEPCSATGANEVYLPGVPFRVRIPPLLRAAGA